MFTYEVAVVGEAYPLVAGGQRLALLWYPLFIPYFKEASRR